MQIWFLPGKNMDSQAQVDKQLIFLFWGLMAGRKERHNIRLVIKLTSHKFAHIFTCPPFNLIEDKSGIKFMGHQTRNTYTVLLNVTEKVSIFR